MRGTGRVPEGGWLPVAIGVLVAMVGASVLVGWHLDVTTLKSVWPGLETMKPWTALGIVLLGAAVATSAGPSRALPTALAVGGGLIGLTMGLEYLVGIRTGFDRLLYESAVRTEGDRLPGRMAPMTSLALVLSAGAIILRARARRAEAYVVATASLLVSAVALVGYLYGVESLRRVGPYGSMALHTATAVTLLDVAILLQMPERGLPALARRGPGPRLLVARALPAVILVPLLVGWLGVQADREGWYETPFGLAVVAVSLSMVAAVLLWHAAGSVADHDDERAAALAEAARARADLEVQVEARTAELAAAEVLQRASLESLEQGVALSDLEGTVLLLNQAGRRILGCDAAELTARFRSGAWDTFDEDGALLERDRRPVGVTMRTGQPVSGAIVRWPMKDGGSVVLRVSTQPVHDRGGALTGVVTAFADVTNERQAERELRASHAQFEALVERTSDIICVVDQSGVVQYLSPVGLRLLSVAVEPGRRFVDALHPDDQVVFEVLLSELAAEHDGVRTETFRAIDADGAEHQLEAVLTNRLDTEAVAGVVVNLRDVTERAEAAARLTYQAFHDSLTGLANRALLLDRLTQAVEHGRRSGSDTALLYIDLDHFKQVNDSLGHEAGDLLLTEVGARISRAVRVGDTVARLGGDEFVVLAEALDRPDEAETIAGRISGGLAAPVRLPGGEVEVTASIGIAHDLDHHAATLLRHADTALYRAKEKGRNRFEVFDESLRRETTRRLTTERLLRRALEDPEGLTLHYQPILDLTTGEPIAAEALLRIEGPDGSLTSPEEFVVTAEETGLIVATGAGVLDLACAQLAVWKHANAALAPPRVTVNVSARQLGAPTFVATLVEAVHGHGLETADLILELTESTIIGADRSTTATVEQLHRLGVGLAVDDFGTGYSSLAYLKRFPIEWVKLDRSFVAGLGRDHRDVEIVRAVVALGRSLGLVVVAEGIETPEQLAALRELGCRCGQGYLLAPPGPASSLTDPEVRARTVEALRRSS